MRTYIAVQECCHCGKHFRIEYQENGTYRYIDLPCWCEAEYYPSDGEPSISEWLESLTH